MTDQETLDLRRRAGYVTPIKPTRKGEPWVVFSGRGFLELMMHPDDAFEALTFGINADGKQLLAKVVGIYPMQNAIQIACHVDVPFTTDWRDRATARVPRHEDMVAA